MLRRSVAGFRHRPNRAMQSDASSKSATVAQQTLRSACSPSSVANLQGVRQTSHSARRAELGRVRVTRCAANRSAVQGRSYDWARCPCDQQLPAAGTRAAGSGSTRCKPGTARLHTQSHHILRVRFRSKNRYIARVLATTKPPRAKRAAHREQTE